MASIAESSRGEARADAPFRAPFLVIDDFLPLADAERMRVEIDRHFAEPHKHQPATHQLWNYWYVPGIYTYLRTLPEKVIEHGLVTHFHAALQDWSVRTLGLGLVTWPTLSLYVDGCQQGLHNDSVNGRFGFVYSLTRDDRKSVGGETLVLREGDLFRGNLARAAAGTGLFDLIAPQFNRLVVFDDRMPHGVQRVDGPMDPLEGRIVLHGHISESGTMVRGPLSPDAANAAVGQALEHVASEMGAAWTPHHGPLVLRLAISAAGVVETLDVLVDRVARSDGISARAFSERTVDAVYGTRFPATSGPSEVTLPIVLGGLLPGITGID